MPAEKNGKLILLYHTVMANNSYVASYPKQISLLAGYQFNV